MQCKQVAEILSADVRDRQSFWKRCELQVHLWMCRNCTRLARQLELIRGAGKRLARDYAAEKPATGEASLEDRLLQRLTRPPDDD